MFWDKVSPLYDFFETVYNRRVYMGTGRRRIRPHTSVCGG